MQEGALGEKWIDCPNCEAACLEREPSAGEELRCDRCGTTVLEYIGKKTLQPAMALSIAGLFALLLANTNPVLSFDVASRVQSEHIITGVEELVSQGYWPIAILVFMAGILAPALHLGSVAYVSTACCLKIPFPRIPLALRLAELAEPWNLMPVYSIATVVSVVKLRMLGGVEWEFGARWVLGVALFSLFAQQTFDRRLVRARLEKMGVAL
jgi:paraquat-inducible protein A